MGIDLESEMSQKIRSSSERAVVEYLIDLFRLQ